MWLRFTGVWAVLCFAFHANADKITLFLDYPVRVRPEICVETYLLKQVFTVVHDSKTAYLVKEDSCRGLDDCNSQHNEAVRWALDYFTPIYDPSDWSPVKPSMPTIWEETEHDLARS